VKDHVNYSRVEASIRYLAEHVREQPSLRELSAHVRLSPFHFQRIFTRWAGISPKKFLQYLTVEELKKEVTSSQNLIEAAEAVGLAGQSRVYDLFVNIEAVTPQEYKTRGEGVQIAYGFHESPFGRCLVATTARGICSLQFVERGKERLAVSALRKAWPRADIGADQNVTHPLATRVFGRRLTGGSLDVLLSGTPFQLKVWRALLNIPFGSLASYQSVASWVGPPSASRAVASAIGRNPVAVLIPCHRVIRKEGLMGEYHWGAARKAAMIGWEKARVKERSLDLSESVGGWR